MHLLCSLNFYLLDLIVHSTPNILFVCFSDIWFKVSTPIISRHRIGHAHLNTPTRTHTPIWGEKHTLSLSLAHTHPSIWPVTQSHTTNSFLVTPTLWLPAQALPTGLRMFINLIQIKRTDRKWKSGPTSFCSEGKVVHWMCARFKTMSQYHQAAPH